MVLIRNKAKIVNGNNQVPLTYEPCFYLEADLLT